MLTRCPACSTHFRVTPEQLKARSGRVRCGECQNVFNALDSLIEEPVLVVAPPAPQPAQAEEPHRHEEAPVPSVERPDETAVPPAPTFSEPEPEPREESPREPEPVAAGSTTEETPAVAEQEPEPVSEPEPLPTLESVEPAADDTLAASLTEAAPEAAEAGPDAPAPTAAEGWDSLLPEPPAPRRWPWVVGSMVALVALLLQATLAYRVELAVLQPETRPALEFLCEFAGCEVGLPAKVGLVGIEASDLHPDREHQGRLALAATLKNRAPFAQQFPHLELTLTDTADQAIARKVLAPADYLPPATGIADGMKPNADIMIALGIDSGGMAASGYRLYLFYP
jgi:predicted Zn finger-like uncharacterized protein